MRVKSLLLMLALASSHFLQAADDCMPKRPADKHLVYQFTEFLTKAELQRLDQKLINFATETSNQIAVVIVDTLCGWPESEYAFQLGQNWGIGTRNEKQRFDNGLLILVKPTGTPGQRKVFIAVGYGLEAVIPDLAAKKIVEREIIPRFKEGKFYDGLNSAITVMMSLAKEEFNYETYAEQKESFPWPILFFVLFFISIIAISYIGRVRRYSRLNEIDFWTAWTLVSQMDNKHTGRWGEFRGGQGGFGGFGGGGSTGGGFGGFGGGGFGGGGAGGSW